MAKTKFINLMSNYKKWVSLYVQNIKYFNGCHNGYIYYIIIWNNMNMGKKSMDGKKM